MDTLNTTLSSTHPVDLCHRYFAAWQQRDAHAVLSTLAPDGTYEDPTTGGPVQGQAFAATMQGLWAAFPDLSFEMGETHQVDRDTVHGEWVMTGTNHGSFHGLPPTGRSVTLRGIDVIRTGPDGIRSVLGYFDPGVVPRQLGLDVVVQPHAIGPIQFGTAVVVRRPHPVMPAVLAFTELIAREDSTVQAIRDQSRQVVLENMDNPAFLGFNGTVVGRRMTTISAWASKEAMVAAMSTGTHVQAMRGFADVAEGGYTAVYAPVRVGPWLRKCSACGSMARFDGHQGHCKSCGAEIEAMA